MINEVWKPIKDWPGYLVSNLGRVKSEARVLAKAYAGVPNARTQSYKEIIRSTRLNVCGYPYMNLSNDSFVKSKTLHRLVAIAFIPNPKNLPQVNHINGIKTDNRVENLEWCTAKENTAHAYKTGLHQIHRGINASRSKLTEDDVRYIRNNKGIYTVNELMDRFKISRSQVLDIQKRKYWSHI